MSLFAIAFLYEGKRLDKVRLFNTETNKNEEVDAKELKANMKSGKVVVNNLLLSGTKFADKLGNPPKITKKIDGRIEGKDYDIIICKIGDKGYKGIHSNGLTRLYTNQNMEEYIGRDNFNNVNVGYRYDELDVVPLYTKIEEGTSGNKVKAVGYRADGRIRGYVLEINGREEFKDDVHYFNSYFLENATVEVTEIDGYEKRKSYSMKLSEECPKLYLVPKDFYESVYDKESAKEIYAYGWCAVLTEAELKDIQAKSGIFNIDMYCGLADVSINHSEAKKYSPVLKDIIDKELDNTAIDIISFVRKKKAEDDAKSPWDSDKWSKKFLQANDGASISFEDAPFNTLLMTTEYEFGTIYKNDRGTGLDMYSVIVKLSDSLIYCITGSYWGVGSSGTDSHSFSQSGYFEVAKKPRGAVRLLKEVNTLDDLNLGDVSSNVVPLRTRDAMTKFAEELTQKYESQGFKMRVFGTDNDLQITANYVGNPNVTELRIPEGVTMLTQTSLVKAPNLTYIHCPSTLKQIGFSLNQLSDLKVITSDSKDVFVEDYVVFEKMKAGVRLRFYPRACENSFYTVPEFVTEIADSAFMDNRYIQIIDIKNKVDISNKSFAGCTSLRELTFRNIKMVEGKFTFRGTKFEQVRLENGYPVSLGSETFANCPELMFAMFSDVSNIANHSFVNCPKLSTLVFCNIDRFTISPKDAFANCPMLELIYLPDFLGGTDIAKNFESAFTVEYYNTDCNDSFGTIAHTIKHKAENQSIIHAGNVVKQEDKDMLATGAVTEITNLNVKAYKVTYLKYNGEVLGYRLTLRDLTRRDISKEVGDQLDFGDYKITSSINLIIDGDDLVSQTEKATGKRVSDISDDTRLCEVYAEHIRNSEM